MDIDQARSRHEQRLLALPNVVGVHIGERNGRPVIKVLVRRKEPKVALRAHELVPPALEGWPTDVEEVRRRHRP